MAKFIGMAILLVSVGGTMLAGAGPTPEIDATSGAAAIGLLVGGLLVLRARKKRR